MIHSLVNTEVVIVFKETMFKRKVVIGHHYSSALKLTLFGTISNAL